METELVEAQINHPQVGIILNFHAKRPYEVL